MSQPLPMHAPLRRRDFLYGLGASLGSVAFTAMLHAESRTDDPLAPKPPHHPARAKACIFLMMAGGPSHIDTFDPKPRLAALHMKKFVRDGDKLASAMASGDRYYVQSPFTWRKVGQAGIEMSDPWVHLPAVADELCVYRGCVAESIDHPTAMYHMNTGNRIGGDPAVGAWATYGLGTLNRDLPAFVVLPEVVYPQGGAANWSNGFLPAHFQGTPLRPSGSPILDLSPPYGVTPEHQRRNLDLLAELNAGHAARRPDQQQLAARMASYELAFRMQSRVPELVDLGAEEARTRELYGLDEEMTADFGRRCLLARRLVERGVRFVQVYSDGWDSHDYLERAHRRRIASVDKPIAALIADLKARGMLDETLIVWCGEFGRSPDNGVRGGGIAYGRDHNAKAMTILLAGGGVRAGQIVGATDELGQQAIEAVHPIRDLHVTLLHLLGLADEGLRYFHAGRYKQLSQVGGKVIQELLA